MATTADLAQNFLDATHDRSVFCEGRIPVFEPSADFTFGPNCSVTDECPLFRAPQFGIIRRWSPGLSSGAECGCEPYRWLREWNRAQQYWVVQFDGHAPQEVQAPNAQHAACVAWWEHVEAGLPIDKMLLFEKQYTVRET